MNEDNQIDVISAASSLEAIQRAEVDVQISTAKRFPRMVSTVKKDMLAFATLDQETAESCFYTLPRGGKNIQGPSVRLAEIAVSCYGNIRAGSRVISVDAESKTPHVVIQSVCHDLEKNISVTIEKRRRITPKKNFKGGGHKPVDEDDINLAANAGSAIAFRDAVFKVVPMALIKPVYEQAKQVAIGDAKTLNDRRSKCIATFGKMGISQERVLQKLGKKSVEDIGLDDLETLLGLHNAIKDGAVNIDEEFSSESLVDEKKSAKQDERDEDHPPGLEPQGTKAKPEKPKEQEADDAPKSPQEDLADVVTRNGFDFDAFISWAIETGLIEEDKATSFDDFPLALAKRLLRGKVDMVAELKKAQKGGKE